MAGCLGDELPPLWWREAKYLVAEHAAHGTWEAVRQAHPDNSVSPRCAIEWWGRLGLPPKPRGPASAITTTGLDDSWLLDTLKKLGDNASVEEVANAADVSPRRVVEAADRLNLAGFRVEADAGAVAFHRMPVETGEHHAASAALFDGDLCRFAVVSDTHLGSKAERLDALHAAYDIIAAEGISVVYHVGDLVDGLGIYRTQNSEVTLHTYEDQIDHAVANYPVREGVETQIISGNHDLEGQFGKAGADPVQAVCNVREDFTYLGRYSAYIDLPNGATMQLLHPMGGGAYATSYRAQKIIESYEGGTKPNVLLIGHLHKIGWFPSRGVQALFAGTFQGPTTYSLRKAFGAPGWGFYIIDCRLADDGSVVRFRPELYPFYLHREAA